ncbi:MAG TPA: hypothetical protein VMH86_06065 [Rhizomicrobium sp.]|nr:hypothetical protein [Rhizomicrobium sp.]
MSKILKKGSVIDYPYLWAEEQTHGETEGRKARPVCLALALFDPKNDIHHLMLVAITSKPPYDDQAAVEVPDTERVRAKLTRYPRAWIIVSEYNYDIAEQSYYFEGSKDVIGTFSDPFLRQVTDALRKEMRRGAKRVDRTI